MKLIDTIEHSLTHYPSLHRNRMDVLEHLFCVIGNGYEWVDGELVDVVEPRPVEEFCYTTDYQTNYDALVVYYQTRMPYLADKKHLEKEAKENQELALKIQDNLEQLKSTPTPICTGVYPMSENHSALLNIPQNVKQDWLLGAKETAEAIIHFYSNEIGEEVVEGLRELSKTHHMTFEQLLAYTKKEYAERGPENLKLAKKALQEINARLEND